MKYLIAAIMFSISTSTIAYDFPAGSPYEFTNQWGKMPDYSSTYQRNLQHLTNPANSYTINGSGSAFGGGYSVTPSYGGGYDINGFGSNFGESYTVTPGLW